MPAINDTFLQSKCEAKLELNTNQLFQFVWDLTGSLIRQSTDIKLRNEQ